MDANVKVFKSHELFSADDLDIKLIKTISKDARPRETMQLSINGELIYLSLIRYRKFDSPETQRVGVKGAMFYMISHTDHIIKFGGDGVLPDIHKLNGGNVIMPCRAISADIVVMYKIGRQIVSHKIHNDRKLARLIEGILRAQTNYSILFEDIKMENIVDLDGRFVCIDHESIVHVNRHTVFMDSKIMSTYTFLSQRGITFEGSYDIVSRMQLVLFSIGILAISCKHGNGAIQLYGHNIDTTNKLPSSKIHLTSDDVIKVSKDVELKFRCAWKTYLTHVPLIETGKTLDKLIELQASI